MIKGVLGKYTGLREGTVVNTKQICTCVFTKISFQCCVLDLYLCGISLVIQEMIEL